MNLDNKTYGIFANQANAKICVPCFDDDILTLSFSDNLKSMAFVVSSEFVYFYLLNNKMQLTLERSVLHLDTLLSSGDIDLDFSGNNYFFFKIIT